MRWDIVCVSCTHHKHASLGTLLLKHLSRMMITTVYIVVRHFFLRATCNAHRCSMPPSFVGVYLPFGMDHFAGCDHLWNVITISVCMITLAENANANGLLAGIVFIIRWPFLPFIVCWFISTFNEIILNTEPFHFFILNFFSFSTVVTIFRVHDLRNDSQPSSILAYQLGLTCVFFFLSLGTDTDCDATAHILCEWNIPSALWLWNASEWTMKTCQSWS